MNYPWQTRLLVTAVAAAALAALIILNPILGLPALTIAVAALMLASRRVKDDGLDVEVVENGDEVMLIARARYGLGLDIHTTSYGFLIRNARGDSRRVELGFHPRIVGKRFQNGVMVLVCRKPGYT